MLDIAKLFDVEDFDRVNDVAVDAFTVSSATADTDKRAAAKSIVSELALYMAEEAFLSDRVTRMTKHGMTGWRKGSLQYLEKRGKLLNVDYNLCGVTGGASERAASLCASYCGQDDSIKCTRVDFAIDIQLRNPKPNYARDLYDIHHSSMGGAIRLVESRSGSTFYRGKRSNQTFGRIYDKSEEYNAELGKVWRFELEFKQPKSQNVWSALYESVDYKGMITNVSAKQWGSWGIYLPIPADSSFSLPSAEIYVSTDTSKMEWVRTIAPAIRRLVSNGNEQEIRALFNLPLFDNG